MAAASDVLPWNNYSQREEGWLNPWRLGPGRSLARQSQAHGLTVMGDVWTQGGIGEGWIHDVADERQREPSRVGEMVVLGGAAANFRSGFRLKIWCRAG